MYASSRYLFITSKKKKCNIKKTNWLFYFVKIIIIKLLLSLTFLSTFLVYYNIVLSSN